jgi:Zn-dependent peptidase ImmA (M78 family)
MLWGCITLKKIKIKDFTWKIYETENEFCDLLYNYEEQRLVNYGITDYENQEITIWGKLPPERKRNTLIHELTHAFIDVYWQGHDKDYNEEEVCCFFGTYGEDILKVVNNYFTNE